MEKQTNDEIAELTKEINDLKLENIKMVKVLEEYEIDKYVKEVSDTEAICLLQINMLLDHAKIREFSKEEVSNLEILHKTLKSVRGQDYGKKTKKGKKLTKKELLELVK
ncbi:MAG: hypothetical protein ACTSV5_10250 [Promethearchaeota archaeon]